MTLIEGQAKKKANELYSQFYDFTPENLAWGTRHNSAKDGALFHVSQIIRKYQEDLAFAGCLNDAKEMTLRLNDWKEVYEELKKISN
jgi:hypothetical protein